MTSLFQEAGCYKDDTVCFSIDALDSFLLGSCKDPIEMATMHCLAVQDEGSIFQYGPKQGLKSFRDALAQFLKGQYKCKVSSANLVGTGGFTYGLTLVCNVLLQHGDPIFIEEPISPKALDIFKCLGYNIIPVPVDEDGLNVTHLDDLVNSFSGHKRQPTAARPYWGAVYVTPNFHDPTGASLSTERCEKLVNIAERHNLLIISNDVYAFLAYKERTPPFGPPPLRLFSYDSSQGDEDDKAGHVISLGSFSTIFAPGLRLGWIEAPQNIIQTLIDSPFIKYTGAPQHYMSAIIESALDLGSLEGPFASLRVTYHSRMNCLCKALKEHIPRANFTQPKGGLFVWAKLPQNINTKELLLACKSKFKVDFEPGRVFSAGGDWNNYLRLSLSHYGEESLVKGVRRISEALMEIT